MVEATVHKEVNDTDIRGLLLAQDNLGVDLMSKLKGRYIKDTFFQTVLNKPKEFRNFEHKEQLVYLKDNDRKVLCIPKVLLQG